MKKIISALLITAMLLTLCVFTASADNAATATVTAGTATTGNTALLTDGNRHSDATALGDGMFVVTNSDASAACTVELVLDLGSKKGVSGYYLDVFVDASASAVAPTAVSMELSEDGNVYFPVYAGPAGIAPATVNDKAVNTYKNDFAYRGNINARYLKAVITFTGEKLAVTEMGVLDAVELYTGSFDEAHPYTMHATGTSPCIAVFDSTDGTLDLTLNVAPHSFLNSYFAIATRVGTTDVYTITLSDVNVWNNDLKKSVHTIESYTLTENEILVAIVTDGSGKAHDNYAICKWVAAGLEAGDKIILKDGMVQFVPKEYEPSNEPTYTEPVVGEKKSLWLTGINGDFSNEGAGIVCTETDGAGDWWNVFAFTPVEGLENVYTLTAISKQEGGVRAKIDVPEGGFLYALHKGNNYPELGQDDKPNYNFPANQAAIELAGSWNVGDIFLIENIDSIPAENEGKSYWLEGWTVEATIATYVPGTGTKPAESDAESSTTGGESSNTSGEPTTGDAGVMMLVVLALVAVVGSAVAVKTRR